MNWYLNGLSGTKLSNISNRIFKRWSLQICVFLSLRFPFYASGLLRQLGNKVYGKEQEVAKELRLSEVKIIKEKLDRGELFVVWSHQGVTDILRIHEGKLRTEVQKKVDGLINTFLEGWKK